MPGNPVQYHFDHSDQRVLGRGPRTGELAQQIEAVAAQAHGPVAVVFAGNRLPPAVGSRAHVQAKGVGRADERPELAQFMQAAQVGSFRVESPSLQVLKALPNGPAPGVKRLGVVEAVGSEEDDEFVRRQGLDPGLPPDPVELHAGEAAHLPGGQPQVGHGLPAAVGVGQAVVLGHPHDKRQLVVLEPLEPRVADELAVAHDQFDAFAAEQGHAIREQGDAVGGVGIAAAVVKQLPAQRHVDVARAGDDEQDVDLALAEIPLRAVQAQAQLALRGQ